MNNDDVLADLLIAWEESFERGTDVPVGELCRDYPDLAAPLAERIAALQEFARSKESPREDCLANLVHALEECLWHGRFAPDRELNRDGPELAALLDDHILALSKFTHLDPSHLSEGASPILFLNGISGDIKLRKTYVFSSSVRCGRRSDLEMTLDDGSVSRIHAEIRPSVFSWVVKDLGSTNGTFCNGIRLGGEATPVRKNDIIQFGKVAFLIELADLGDFKYEHRRRTLTDTPGQSMTAEQGLTGRSTCPWWAAKHVHIEVVSARSFGSRRVAGDGGDWITNWREFGGPLNDFYW